MSVAIVIPTLNRSTYVIRQLEFYQKVGNKHSVYIGDSSLSSHRDDLSKHIKTSNYSYPIHHLSCSKMNDSEAIYHCLTHVKESYVTFAGDDDFHIPETLTKCAEFLKNNSSYSSCHGQGILFEMKNTKGIFKLNFGPYYMSNLLQKCASERLLEFLRNYYVLLFSVHRLEEFKKSFEIILKISDKSFREIFPNMLTAIDGKSKIFSELGFIRETHDSRYLLPKTIDWISHEEWSKNLAAGIKMVAEEIKTKENIENTKIINKVHEGLLAYFALKHFDLFNQKDIWPIKFCKRIANKFKLIFMLLKNKFYINALNQVTLSRN